MVNLAGRASAPPGYGGTVEIPAIDVISTEPNVIGNLVGSYNDLVELMAQAAAGQSATS